MPRFPKPADVIHTQADYLKSLDKSDSIFLIFALVAKLLLVLGVLMN